MSDMEKIRAEIGARIKARRLELYMTQEELADRCELTKGYISQLENDLNSPSIATLSDIIDALGTTLKEFFNEEEEQKLAYKKADYVTKEQDKMQFVWLIPSAQKNEMELIAVVLNGATSDKRFSDAKALLNYGFANYAAVSPQITPQSIPVKLGTSATVQAIPVQQPELLVDKSQRDQVHTEMTLEESVAAPVSKGQRLGTLSVKVGEHTIAQIPMVAAEAVPRLTWSDLFLMVLRRFAMAK